MIDEVQVYRIVGVIFLVLLPIAIACVILPARTIRRKRIRSTAAVFIGLGILFIGWVLSWPGPNSFTLMMMGGGLTAFLVGSFFLVRSLIQSKAS